MENRIAKVYKVNDFDWYAGYSLEECIEKVIRDSGCDYDEIVHNPYQVSEADMDKLMFVPDDDGPRRAFRIELYRMVTCGTKLPCLFASTEY